MSQTWIVTRFLKSPQQAQQEWLRLLISDENVPLDIASKAQYCIYKVHYPYDDYRMACQASWKALSIWEHQESYQETSYKTVYIDYQGNEHNTQGNDREYRNGVHIDHYRQPQQRAVVETKYRTVIDNQEYTSGDIGPLEVEERVQTSNLPDLAWTTHFQPDQFMQVDAAYFRDSKVMPETVSADDSMNRANRMARSDIDGYAQDQVPGNRHEDFELTSFNVVRMERATKYLGVYHIIYQYEGDQYECCLTGGSNRNDFVFGQTPVDRSIQERNAALDGIIADDGSCLQLFLGIYIFPLVCIAGFGMAPMLLRSQNILLIALSFVVAALGAIGGVGAVNFIARFIMMKKSSKKATKEKEQYANENTFYKQQILAISQDKTVPPYVVQQRIAAWLTSYAANVASRYASPEVLKQQHANKTKRLNALSVIAAAVIAIIFIIWMLAVSIFGATSS